MSRKRKILLGVLTIFILIQLIQPARNTSDVVLPTDLSKVADVPANVQNILQVACLDCHSNNTRYPWYSVVQPFGWLLADHIKKGKAELNFSEFGSYSKRRQVSKLNGVIHSIQDGTMPIRSYLWMHHDARLSEQQKKLVIEWATRTKDSLELNN